MFAKNLRKHQHQNVISRIIKLFGFVELSGGGSAESIQRIVGLDPILQIFAEVIFRGPSVSPRVLGFEIQIQELRNAGALFIEKDVDFFVCEYHFCVDKLLKISYFGRLLINFDVTT